MTLQPDSPDTASTGPEPPTLPKPSSSIGQCSPPSRLAQKFAQLAVIRKQRQSNEDAPRLSANFLKNTISKNFPIGKPALESNPENPKTYDQQMREHLARKKEIQQEIDRVKCWQESRVPKLHRDSVDNARFTGGEWGQALAGLCAKLDDGFMAALVGQRGSGKTQLSACLSKAAADRCMSVRYYRAMDLFLDARACFSDKSRSEIELVKIHENLGFLVIDEAHVRGNSDWEDRTLNHILDHRYGSKRATLIISNQSMKDFVAQVGLSVVSRMNETGMIIDCSGWTDRRDPDQMPLYPEI